MSLFLEQKLAMPLTSIQIVAVKGQVVNILGSLSRVISVTKAIPDNMEINKHSFVPITFYL